MKKTGLILIALCNVFLFLPKTVSAHPGGLDANGGHHCRTNCPSWGLETGEYHFHSGSTYRNSKGQTYNSDGTLIPEEAPSTPSNTEANDSNNYDSGSYANNTPNTPSSYNVAAPIIIAKSSDNTLKSVTVDGRAMEISDTMNYETKEDKVEIKVEPNDSAATYEIGNASLVVGDNPVPIKVTAENGDVKEYVMIITRKSLSNNTNMKLFVDAKEIEFDNDQATIDAPADMESLTYEYVLEDQVTQIKIDDDKELKPGENTITFTVTAEDGTVKVYVLTVNKASSSPMGTILGITVTSSACYGAYSYSKKKEKSSTKK